MTNSPTPTVVAMVDPNYYGANDAAPMPGAYWHYSANAVRSDTIYSDAPVATGQRTYSDATDDAVLANYAAACSAEVACHDRGEDVPAIVQSTCDEWMREGFRRGIL
jgi:hypothetical protein